MDLTVLNGPNFSGRTARLRDWVGLPNGRHPVTRSEGCVFVGPNPANALSGLAPTVSAEIEVMSADRDAHEAGLAALERLGFGYIRDQNPFTLSGGEQVVCAVVAAMAGRPKRLAIDCALEQLAPETRASLIGWLLESDGSLMLADNRLNEWFAGETVELAADPNAPVVRQASAPLAKAGDGCLIELIDLTFGYSRNKLVFDRVNITLEQDKMYHLAGPNGSGKSTISKIVCGLLKPISGEIRIDNRAVKLWQNPGKLAAYHFQNPAFQLFGNRSDEMFDTLSEFKQATTRFGLDANGANHPLDLPYVLAKRLALGATMLRKSPMKILDEPTIGQDCRSGGNIAKLAKQYAGIVVSHSKLFADCKVINLLSSPR
jgi:energy-coupling factor transporter ATP-binding protein EcfA2